MNCSIFRLRSVWLCVCVSLCAVFPISSISAQAPIYSVEYPVFPEAPGPATTFHDLSVSMDVSGNPVVIGVGSLLQNLGLEAPNVRRGFIYDHYGTFGEARRVYMVDDLDLGIEFPPSWMPNATENNLIAVNSHGRVAGYVRGDDGIRVPVYLELFERDEFGAFISPRKLHKIELPDSEMDGYGRVVTESGDILVHRHASYPYIFNPDTDEAIRIPIQCRATSRMNNLRQVVARRNSDDITFRHTLLSPDGSGITELFPELHYATTINDDGQIAGDVVVPLDTKGNPRNREGYLAVRVDFDGSIGWQSDIDLALTEAEINQFGDMVFDSKNDTYSRTQLVYFEGLGSIFDVKKLINELDSFLMDGYLTISTRHDRGGIFGRDHTGFPWMAGTTDTNGDGWIDACLLIPQPPLPTVIVDPAGDLIVSESGDSASFDVTLNTQPLDEVMFTLGSSDISEGTIDKGLLTFTPLNWNTPQTVTITGIDDGEEDGDVTFTIALDPVVSLDPDYDGLDPHDVTVTNLDDDTRRGGKGGGKNK